MGAWLALALLLGWSARAWAEEPSRGLISPAPGRPLKVQPGELASLVVRSATALTPPPGIQEPRAHRAFAISLCAEGVPLSGPARVCFAVPVEDLRPLSGHSLVYRLDVRVPRWVAPGSYELVARYPGGTQAVVDGLRVGQLAKPVCARVEHTWGPARAARVSCEQDGFVRVHARDAQGIRVEGLSEGALQAYPMPDEQGEFAEGVVALIAVRAAEPLTLTRGRPQRGAALAAAKLASVQGEAASGLPDAATLEVQNAPAGARIFWRLSPWHSELGARAVVRFKGTSRAGTASAAVIGPDASVRVLRMDLTRLGQGGLGAGGCEVGDARGGWGALGLLFLALSRKLGPLRRFRAVEAQVGRE